MTPIAVALVLLGAVLLWAAITNADIVAEFRSALGGGS